jgi:hypothetical protein
MPLDFGHGSCRVGMQGLDMHLSGERGAADTVRRICKDWEIGLLSELQP